MAKERLDTGPNPEELLKWIQSDESRRSKGRLKIFLGMAAGVGKTYSMLEAAGKKVLEGVNLLVGNVETHGRIETAKLLEPLKQIPPKEMEYKGKIFLELDTDQILKLHPQLVLVDELAHSNVPGSKHLKRWQDVVEILEAGIDVFTTLNIQHIESYKDIIEGIVGIKIFETVPDHVIERAADIELVDITPAELLQRLKEGKVYTGDISEVAARNFFQEDRLTALREVTLRFTAEIVDIELHQMFTSLQKGRVWKARERILVAIDHNPFVQQLIRRARWLAVNLHAPWVVAYVDTGKQLSDEEKGSLSKNLSLSRELAAEVITTQDTEISEALCRIIQQKNITQVIVGKTTKSFWRRIFKGSLAESLAQTCDVDVHIMRPSSFSAKKKRIKKHPFNFSRFFPFLHILLWFAIFTGLNVMIVPYVGYKVVGTIFAILFFLAALTTGILANRVKTRQDLLIKKERSTQAIYEIVKEISAAPTSAQLFQAVKEKLGVILQGSCEIIPSTADGHLNFENSPVIASDEKEKAVAVWVYEHGKEAGWSTSTLPSVKYLYIPLKGYKENVGVLPFRRMNNNLLLPEEMNFLYTVSQQLAHFLERSRSEEKQRTHLFFIQIEQLYSKVLKSISEELTRPLQTIQKSLTVCRDEKEVQQNAKVFQALQSIEKTAESLFRIADNAKAMAKLSGGMIAFRKQRQDISTLIQLTREDIKHHLKQHRLEVLIADDLPQVPFDFSLISLLLHNLLMNAIEYSPPQSTIIIEAAHLNKTFILSVLDEGKGIPEGELELIFEKFYRVHGTISTGLGLGLAIVKAIAEIHEGRIKAHNRPTGGAKFSLILPI
jgi:two-component system, OmpR family, sensor histidine kinase KdpD